MPANFTKKSQLSHINVLVMDADSRIATLLRNVLTNLGFGKIYTANSGTAGMQILNANSIDLIITDWDMEPMNGIDFIKHIRTNNVSINRMIPIIMLTGKSNRQHVEFARDAGMTEFVVKPFSVQTLCNHIMLVVEHPRNFIMASNFAGPCRRRRNLSPDGVEDRRKEITDEHIVAKKGPATILRIDDQKIVCFEPNYELKEKIVDKAREKTIFSSASVQMAQTLIESYCENFLEWAKEDIANLEKHYAQLQTNGACNSENIKEIQDCALLIKSRAGTFGFDLASCVADLLVKTCENKSADNHKLFSSVIHQHINALQVIFLQKIKGNGAEMGTELLDGLFFIANKLEDKTNPSL